MFIEATYGIIQNQLGTPIVSPASNRCNVGLCDMPLLFPDAGVMNPSYYNYQVLQDIQSPMLVNGRIMLPPTFISLPFKILLFILVDGWDLVIKALVQSFH